MLKFLVLVAFAIVAWTLRGVGPHLGVSLMGAHAPIPVLASSIVVLGVLAASKVRPGR